METSLTTTQKTNWPTSLLLSEDKLSQALQKQDPEFVSSVFVRYQKPVGIEKAVSSKSPSFHDVTAFFSEQSTLFWLRFHIAETFAFLGIYDTASVYQIRATAELILRHEIFGQLTLDEFLCFLQRFKQGRYGRIYNSQRPNPQEFLKCLEPFWNELSHERGKAEERERQKKISEAVHSPDNMTYEQWRQEKEAAGEEIINTTNPLNR